MVTGAVAGSVAPAALVLYEAGGHRVLDESTKAVMRQAVGASASDALKNGTTSSVFPKGIALSTPASLTKAAATTATKVDGAATAAGAAAAGRSAATAAARTVLSGVGRAAAIGGVVDGVIATGEAVYHRGKGDWSTNDALMHVAGETATGAAAAAAGVGAAAGFVALTGAVAAPAVAVVAAGTAIAAKAGLVKAWHVYRQPGRDNADPPAPPPAAPEVLTTATI